MIELETLPEPQWMSLGRKVERVYTQEWLLLAMEALRDRRLLNSDLKSPFVPEGYKQFAIRFNSSDWTLEEIVATLDATNHLWRLCNAAVGVDTDDVGPLRVRRLSAGSPMDILVTIREFAAAAGGPAAAAAFFIWVLKNPEKVAGALPRAIAEWREQWARVTRAGTDQRRARLERERFEEDTKVALESMKNTPSVTGLATNDPVSLTIQFDDESRPRKRFFAVDAPEADEDTPKAIESSQEREDER